jgi:hypothetical protein
MAIIEEDVILEVVQRVRHVHWKTLALTKRVSQQSFVLTRIARQSLTSDVSRGPEVFSMTRGIVIPAGVLPWLINILTSELNVLCKKLTRTDIRAK